jgi:large repetitive protein
VSVSWSKGASAQGQPGCSSVYCRWVNVSASGLNGGTRYAITCWDNVNGRADQYTSYATAQSDGDLSAGNVCYFGYPDRSFWVRLEPGGHESAHRQFGS